MSPDICLWDGDDARLLVAHSRNADVDQRKRSGREEQRVGTVDINIGGHPDMMSTSEGKGVMEKLL